MQELLDRSAAMAGQRSLRVLITRLQSRMSDLGLNPRNVASSAGLGKTAVYDIIAGRNKNPSAAMLGRIATILKCDPGYLLGTQEAPLLSTRPLVGTPIRVIGAAEAGAFRIMRDFSADSEADLPVLHAPSSRLHPTAKHFALEVRGDSMNAAKPYPVLDGTFVLCVDLTDTQLPVENGEIYAIRRTIDGGQTYECTIKRARVFRDRVELRPESTNPIHQPLVLPRNFVDTDGDPKEIQAIGLVYGTYHSYERP